MKIKSKSLVVKIWRQIGTERCAGRVLTDCNSSISSVLCFYFVSIVSSCVCVYVCERKRDLAWGQHSLYRWLSLHHPGHYLKSRGLTPLPPSCTLTHWANIELLFYKWLQTFHDMRFRHYLCECVQYFKQSAHSFKCAYFVTFKHTNWQTQTVFQAPEIHSFLLFNTVLKAARTVRSSVWESNATTGQFKD